VTQSDAYAEKLAYLVFLGANVTKYTAPTMMIQKIRKSLNSRWIIIKIRKHIKIIKFSRK